MKLAAICVAPTELGGLGEIYYKHVAPSGAPALQRQLSNRATSCPPVGLVPWPVCAARRQPACGPNSSSRTVNAALHDG
jgi:hypothetical protein